MDRILNRIHPFCTRRTRNQAPPDLKSSKSNSSAVRPSRHGSAVEQGLVTPSFDWDFVCVPWLGPIKLKDQNIRRDEGASHNGNAGRPDVICYLVASDFPACSEADLDIVLRRAGSRAEASDHVVVNVYARACPAVSQCAGVQARNAFRAGCHENPAVIETSQRRRFCGGFPPNWLPGAANDWRAERERHRPTPYWFLWR